MIKIIESNSFDWDEPEVSVLDFSNIANLTKTAAHSEINAYIKNITPDKDKIYLHILALSAMDATGINRNGDGFPFENLKACYKTFEEGHIFSNHVNKQPEKAMGKIIYAVLNERMMRVELIAWVDKKKGGDFVRRIDNGEFPSMSMAVKTAFDRCSICGNEARTRQEYCHHLQNEIGRMYPDGRVVGAINVAPLRFFEQSAVFRGADPLSSVLQKVASSEQAPIIGSAELAEIEGLTEKAASHKKLSELIKEIEGNVVDYDSNLEPLLAKVSDPHESTIPALAQHELVDVFATLAHLGITPSLRFLADLIAHKVAGPDAHGIGTLVEGYIGANGVQELLLGDKTYDESKGPDRRIIDILSPSVKQASLNSDSVIERSMLSTSRGMFVPGTNVGYVGNGPHIEETPTEQFNRMIAHPEAHSSTGIIGMIKSLIVIGGAALAAKWFITNMIEKKMQEAQARSNHGVKIALANDLNDYRSTYLLAKSAMVKTIKKL